MKIKTTQYPFYGKYLYKASILVTNINTNDSFKTNRHTLFNVNTYFNSFISSYPDADPRTWINEEIKNSFKTRYNYVMDPIKGLKDRDISYDVTYMFVFYLLTEEDLNKIIDHFGERVLEISKPINDKHINMINDNLNVEVKDRLYWDKYRYKFSFATSKSFSIYNEKSGQTVSDAVLDFLEDNFDEDQYKVTKKRLVINNVYIKDEEPAMFFKLTWNDDCSNVVRVKTKSELESQ